MIWRKKPKEEPPKKQPKPKTKPEEFPEMEFNFDQAHQDHIERAIKEVEKSNTFKSDSGEKVSTMDGSVSNVSPKFGFSGAQQSVSPSLLSWYVSQGFIGWQSCAFIAQHWLVDKACSIKGRDAVRNGYDVAIVDEEEKDVETIKKIERLDRAYKVKHHLQEADRYRNIFGIRHILFQIDGIDYSKPFNPDGIRPKQYKGMTQIDPYWITPQLSEEGVQRPDKPGFYIPEYWIVAGQTYHRSHFVILYGSTVPDIMKPSYIYGGLPLTQKIMDRVYNAERVANEAPILALTKRLNVFKTDLAQIATKYTAFQRLMTWMTKFRDNFGVRVISKDDEHEQLDTSLTDLDDVIMTEYQLVASVAEVPATKLLGTSPKGFNATGEHEIHSYHEALESIQENDLSLIVDAHHLRLARSELDSDIEIEHVWCPLAVMTDEEEANVQKTKAETAKIYSDIGAIDGYDVRDAIITDEKSDFASLEKVERPDGEDIDLTPSNTGQNNSDDQDDEDTKTADEMVAMDYIRRLEDGRYYVFSESGKRLSRGYSSKEKAAKRLAQIEWFKDNK